MLQTTLSENAALEKKLLTYGPSHEALSRTSNNKKPFSPFTPSAFFRTYSSSFHVLWLFFLDLNFPLVLEISIIFSISDSLSLFPWYFFVVHNLIFILFSLLLCLLSKCFFEILLPSFRNHKFYFIFSIETNFRSAFSLFYSHKPRNLRKSVFPHKKNTPCTANYQHFREAAIHR